MNDMPNAPSREQRDSNLDALAAAMDRFGEQEQTRLENEVKFLRQVLSGRGSQAAVSANLEAASSLVQESLTQFIAFSEA